jgi:hypothetical protein
VGETVVLETLIKQEFLQGSAISPEIFGCAIQLLPDIVIDHVTHEVIDTPLANALNRNYVRFGKYGATPNQIGVAFLQETGEIWQFKIFGGEETGEKSGKYHSPKKPDGTLDGDLPYLPPIPRDVWDAIAQAHGIDLPSDQDQSFWEWLKLNKNIPVVLTEGAKKSLASFSVGIPAISLYGCNCGVNSVTKHLKDALHTYLEGRKVYICLDQDHKAKTRRTVKYATKKLCKAISWAGGSPYQVSWNYQEGKGLDDLLRNQGVDYFKDKIAKAVFKGINPYTPLELPTANSEPQQSLIDDLIEADQKAKLLNDQGFGDVLSTLRTPTLEVNQASLEGILGQLSRIGKLGVCSPKKTRKSSGIIEPLKAEWVKKGKLVISITPRILLTKEQKKSWQIETIDEMGNVFREFHSTIGLCFDSLGKIAYKDWSGALIILDEVRQGLKHFISSSTLQEMRSYYLKLLSEKLPQAVNGGGLIVYADADLTDVEVDYIEAICPVGESFILKNNFVATKGTVIFNTGKYDQVLTELFQRYQQGQNLFVFSTSKSDSNAIYSKLKEDNPDDKIWLINGDTTEEKETKDIIGNCINKAIKEQQPRALIFTTSMSTGVSIDGIIDKQFDPEVFNHFDYGFAIAQGGILEPVEITQGMARNRKDIDFTVYCGNGRTKEELLQSTDWEVIKRQILKRNDRGLNLLQMIHNLLEEKLGRDPTHLEVSLEMVRRCDPETGELIDPHIDLYCKVIARSNHAFKNFQLNLYKQLQSEGFQVVIGEKNLKNTTIEGEQHKENKKQQPIIEAKEIFEAEDIPLEEAREIEFRSATREERLQASKAFLKAELPEIELTPERIHKLITKDRRKTLNAIKLFYLYQNPEIAQDIDATHLVNKIRQFAQGVIFLPDIRNYSIILDEIKELGLFELIDIDNPTELSKDDPRVIGFIQKAFFRRYKVYNALGLTITPKTSPIAFLDRLLSRFGLGLKCTRVEKQGKEKIRFYSLNLELVQDIDRLAVLEAFDRRFKAKTENETNTPQTSPPHTLEVGTRLFEGLYNNGSGVPCETSPQLDSTAGQDTMLNNTPPPPGIEDATSEEIISWLVLIENVDGLRWLVHDTGLSKAQRQKALELLPESEKRRLAPIFEELKRAG